MKHNPATRRQAIELLARPELTLEDIAARVGANRRTLYNWARAAGLPLRSRAHGSIYTPAVKRKAVRLYQQGETMAEIGAQTGASVHAIREWAKAAGVPLRRTHTNARIDTNEAVRLAKEHGARGAAELLGCAVSTIRYHQDRAVVLAIRAKLARR